MAAAIAAINSFSVVDMEYLAEENITCLQNGTNSSSCSPNQVEAVISRYAHCEVEGAIWKNIPFFCFNPEGSWVDPGATTRANQNEI